MSRLVLSKADSIKIRSSWADAIALSHFNDQNFVKLLFSNLITYNGKMKILFKNSRDLEEQEQLVTEMLSFTMMYLDKVAVLEECMVAFIQENVSLLQFGPKYLEPLGSELIRALREVLGSGQFHAGLETLWIKVYVYLANSILKNDIPEVNSDICNADRAYSLLDEEVQPLNIRPFSSSAPNFTNSSVHGVDSPKIIIDLKGNEKYRGFRRSVNEISRSTVSITIPSNMPLSSNLEYQTYSDSNDSILTPRSHKRNLAQQFQDLGLKVEKFGISDLNSPIKGSSFDPRRKRCHRKTPSEVSTDLDIPQRKSSFASCESPISDFEDQIHQGEDEIDFSPFFEARSPIFDHTSFGIAGLAPIAESDNDDKSNYSLGHTSSSCNSKDERRTEHDSSSRDSSLSLHHSDYKSSISSISGQSRFMEKDHKVHITDAGPTENPQFSSPYSHTKLSSSVPSLISKNNGPRASMGFMRSCFVLKQEIDNLGYNPPENVVLSKTQHSLPKPSYVPISRSVCSLPIQHKKGNTMESRSRSLEQTFNDEKGNFNYTDPKSKSEKSSFRKFLRGIFGSSASLSTKSTKPNSQPTVLSLHSGNPSKPVELYASRNLGSIATSSYSSKRVSALDVRGTTSPVGYAASVYSKPTIISDNASVMTTNSGRKSFSLFRGEGKCDTKKKNKYLVKKVAYKTVHLTDIVS